HVVDRTDAFTLVGSDARRGKLTLFAAEGPRERGALKHVALRVSSLDDAIGGLNGAVERPREGEAYVDISEGLRLGFGEAPAGARTTSTPSRSSPPRPRRPRASATRPPSPP